MSSSPEFSETGTYGGAEFVPLTQDWENPEDWQVPPVPESGSVEVLDPDAVREQVVLALSSPVQPAELKHVAEANVASPVPATERHAHPEAKKEKVKITTRAATVTDVDTLVDIDMVAFKKVYAAYDKTPEELREDLLVKFRLRYEKLGGQWIRLAERDGQPVGFMMACPTSKKPEELTSWEELTDNGTLNSTYDPKGENIYMVSLSMLPRAGELARKKLFMYMTTAMTKSGRNTIFFENRLPGLKDWAERECKRTGADIDQLGDADKLELANVYANLKVTRNGKELPYDYLMRIYTQAGCRFGRVLPNAYADEQSMDFGMVGIFAPLPSAIVKNRFTRWGVGKLMDLVGKSNWAVKKIF